MSLEEPTLILDSEEPIVEENAVADLMFDSDVQPSDKSQQDYNKICRELNEMKRQYTDLQKKHEREHSDYTDLKNRFDNLQEQHKRMRQDLEKARTEIDQRIEERRRNQQRSQPQHRAPVRFEVPTEQRQYRAPVRFEVPTEQRQYREPVRFEIPNGFQPNLVRNQTMIGVPRRSTSPHNSVVHRTTEFAHLGPPRFQTSFVRNMLSGTRRERSPERQHRDYRDDRNNNRDWIRGNYDDRDDVRAQRYNDDFSQRHDRL